MRKQRTLSLENKYQVSKELSHQYLCTKDPQKKRRFLPYFQHLLQNMQKRCANSWTLPEKKRPDDTLFQNQMEEMVEKLIVMADVGSQTNFAGKGSGSITRKL